MSVGLAWVAEVEEVVEEVVVGRERKEGRRRVERVNFKMRIRVLSRVKGSEGTEREKRMGKRKD